MVAFGVLTLAVVLLAGFNLGLAQRIIQVLDRLEGQLGEPAAGPLAAGLSPGSAAPPLPAADDPGQDLPPRDSASSIVMFLDAGCQPCEGLLADLGRRRLDLDGRQKVAVVDKLTPAITSNLEGWRVLEDPDSATFRSWQVTGTPLAYVIDADGKVRDATIPNSSRDLERVLRVADTDAHARHP